MQSRPTNFVRVSGASRTIQVDDRPERKHRRSRFRLPSLHHRDRYRERTYGGRTLQHVIWAVHPIRVRESTDWTPIPRLSKAEGKPCSFDLQIKGARHAYNTESFGARGRFGTTRTGQMSRRSEIPPEHSRTKKGYPVDS
jgi:hypothetical protein